MERRKRVFWRDENIILKTPKIGDIYKSDNNEYGFLYIIILGKKSSYNMITNKSLQDYSYAIYDKNMKKVEDLIFFTTEIKQILKGFILVKSPQERAKILLSI